MLRSLLERHSELVAEAIAIAKAAVSDVDADAIADDVEQAVLDLDMEDIRTQAGRNSWGYVEPNEAVWELLGKAVNPFLDQTKRYTELSFEAAATGMCAGIVLSLYRCRGKQTDKVIAWAEDFPAETASRAEATLVRASTAKHRRAWRLADVIVDQVPEWTNMLGRAAKPATERV